MRSVCSIVQEIGNTGHWYSEDDKLFCQVLLKKNWTDYTEREVSIVEMLSLKYADVPNDDDLSLERILN